MSQTASAPVDPASTPEPDYDVIVVGAGFSGLSMLYQLRDSGLSVRCLDDGDEIGGTWFWNTYPGARTDTDAATYAFSFAKDELQDWNWTERRPGQQEVKRYLNFVADRLDLRKDVQLRTRVEQADFDEDAVQWVVRVQDGSSLRATYLVMALGPLSATYTADLPGLSDFAGQVLNPQRWPEGGVDLSGRRVGLVGTGATGVQLIPELAPEVSELTVFQRTPNYVVPSRNHALSEADMDELRAAHEQIWRQATQHPFSMPFDLPERSALEVSEEERNRAFEAAWTSGGFALLFEPFHDVLTNIEANELVAEFIRGKIREIVHDPETAEMLCPKGYPYGGKRPPAGTDYYETFNRPNVKLVDIKRDPIDTVTATGLRTKGGVEYEFDTLILATGFDAFTGSYTRLPITGLGGQKLNDKWAEGPRTFLSAMTEGFPNLFMVCGPHMPFTNVPPTAQFISEWIGRLIRHSHETGRKFVDVDSAAEQAWTDQVNQIADMMPIYAGGLDSSFFAGGNIPGKKQAVLSFFAGGAMFREIAMSVESKDYEGLVMR